VIRVGLSGGLGSGKSTVGQALAARGAAVIDADQVARDILAPGSPGEQAVVQRFGPRVTGPDGSLDRPALARIVFADAGERSALEAITHPLIHHEIESRLSALAQGVAVVELPLLDADRRRHYGLDLVVLVEAPEDTAVRRAVGRGMAEDDVRSRIAAQPTDDQRRAAADRVLDNAGSREELEARVSDLWRWLSEQA
jgi:dephospho-CoA kinase